MTTLIEAARQALEALEYFSDTSPTMAGKAHAEDAITTLRTAIEQAEKQEPVAYAVYHRMGGSKTLHWPEQHSEDGDAKEYKLVPLYTTPPAAPVQERNFCERCGKRLGDGHIHTCTPPEAQRQWVGLSDLDMDELENEYMKSAQTAHEFLRAIEAALRSKNT